MVYAVVWRVSIITESSALFQLAMIAFNSEIELSAAYVLSGPALTIRGERLSAKVSVLRPVAAKSHDANVPRPRPTPPNAPAASATISTFMRQQQNPLTFK